MTPTGIAVLVVAAIVIGFLGALVGAAFLMLALSLIHNDLPVVPALGFWSSFGTLLALSAIGGALRGGKLEAKA